MSRPIKFRAWDKEKKKYLLPEEQDFVILPTEPSFGATIPFQSEYYPNETLDIDCVDWADADLIMGRYELEQYTGLKDKNGKEIYENCELDGRYKVEYIAPKFVGKDMVKGDVIELYDNKFTITKEHCEISQNSERSTN